MKLTSKTLLYIIAGLLVLIIIFAIVSAYLAYQYDMLYWQVQNLTESCVPIQKYGGETEWIMNLG